MKALLRNPAEVSSSTNIDGEKKKNSEHIDKIYTTRKMILGSWEKMKGINKVLRMVKNECNRIVCKKKTTEKWWTGSKLMLRGRVWGDYVRCMPAAREGAIGETNVHSSIMCLFLAVIWLHSFLSGCEHLMYAFVFCISSLFPSFWFSSPSLLVGLFSVAPCKSSLLLHRFSIIFFICDFTQFYTWVYFFLFLF